MTVGLIAVIIASAVQENCIQPVWNQHLNCRETTHQRHRRGDMVIEGQMDKIDFIILNILVKESAINRVKTLTNKQIAEELLKYIKNKYDILIKERQVQNRMNNLIKLNYVEKGLNLGKTHTYFITAEGTDLIGYKQRRG